MSSSTPWSPSTASKRKRSDASERASDRSSPSFADDVSADFQDALRELSTNDRYQISNLTVIANESVDPQDPTNAHAIANVLTEHIKKTPPIRKLPALYVLDSIVKNVGEPYLSIFSPNLFTIFLGAYSLVEPTTRKNMEAMLRTWKDPMPGMLNSTPIFPQDVLRAIDTALIKHRTAAEQQRHQQPRPPSAAQQPHHHQQPQQQQQQHYQQAPFQPTPPVSHYASPIPGFQHQPQQQYQQLVSPPPTQQASYQPPMPPSQQQYHQLQHPPAPQSPHTYQNFQPLQTQSQFPTNLNLASLLQHASSQPQSQQYQQQIPQAPPFQQPPPAINSPHQPHQQHQQQQQQPAANFPGLEALLGYQKPLEQPTPPNHGRIPTPQPRTSTGTPAQSYLFTPPIKPATLSSVPTIITNDAKLTSASLKINRPALLATLYADRPRQCNSCGRRFAATTEGQARKSRHLDNHFRTNRRIAQIEDAGGKGISRSWYVEEMEWIAAKEWDDANEGDPNTAAAHAAANAGAEINSIDGKAGVDGLLSGAGTGRGGGSGGGSLSSGGAGSKAQNYIKAPVDAALVRYTCPICQEEFKAIWHDEAQEWVWMDAVKIQDKVYHGTCLREMTKDGGGASSASPTSASAGGGSAAVKTGTLLNSSALGVRPKTEY